MKNCYEWQCFLLTYNWLNVGNIIPMLFFLSFAAARFTFYIRRVTNNVLNVHCLFVCIFPNVFYSFIPIFIARIQNILFILPRTLRLKGVLYKRGPLLFIPAALLISRFKLWKSLSNWIDFNTPNECFVTSINGAIASVCQVSTPDRVNPKSASHTKYGGDDERKQRTPAEQKLSSGKKTRGGKSHNSKWIMQNV